MFGRITCNDKVLAYFYTGIITLIIDENQFDRSRSVRQCSVLTIIDFDLHGKLNLKVGGMGVVYYTPVFV
jgi:hypothetical protein